MKNENLIYALVSFLILVGAATKILHVPYGNLLFTFSFVAAVLLQSWHISKLKKRIEELEK